MYNQYNKPVSRRAYSNYSSSRDTNDIVLTGFDTLYYDNQHRVTQLDYFDSWANRIVRRKKFFYKGSDPMMYKYENYSAEPPRDTLGLFSTAEFVYTDTAVLSIQMNLKGGIDTTHFVYKGGNYAYWYAPGVVDEHVGYYEYDNKPNVERCFNLPQPGLIFPLPQDYTQTMKPSRNNWVLANGTSNTPDFGRWRSITYNEHDLIHSTHTVDYSGPC